MVFRFPKKIKKTTVQSFSYLSQPIHKTVNSLYGFQADSRINKDRQQI